MISFPKSFPVITISLLDNFSVMYLQFVMNIMFLLRTYENIAVALAAVLSCVEPSGEWCLLCAIGDNRSVFGAFPEGSVEQANRYQIVTVASIMKLLALAQRYELLQTSLIARLF